MTTIRSGAPLAIGCRQRMQEADQFGSGRREKGADLGEEAREIALDESPHILIVDNRVLMHEQVAKVNDPPSLRDGQCRLYVQRVLQRFADDDELPLDRGAQTSCVQVIVE